MSNPTPGQVAYAAYVAARYGLSLDDATLTYGDSIPAERDAWEAAAQAVRAAQQKEETPCSASD